MITLVVVVVVVEVVVVIILITIVVVVEALNKYQKQVIDIGPLRRFTHSTYK